MHGALSTFTIGWNYFVQTPYFCGHITGHGNWCCITRVFVKVCVVLVVVWLKICTLLCNVAMLREDFPPPVSIQNIVTLVNANCTTILLLRYCLFFSVFYAKRNIWQTQHKRILWDLTFLRFIFLRFSLRNGSSGSEEEETKLPSYQLSEFGSKQKKII